MSYNSLGATSSTENDHGRDGDADLVSRARNGEQEAWTTIVRRYQTLVNSVVRRHRFTGDDADDLSQQVWTQLIENIDRLRTPEALPGWIATTAARACLAEVKRRRRTVNVDPTTWETVTRTAPSAGFWGEPGEVDDDLLRQERRRVVRESLSALTADQKQFLTLLMADPPVPYRQISHELGMPLGSIGPTRARLLKKLGGTAPVRLLEGSAAYAPVAA